GGAGAIFQSANDMATRFETELEMFQDAMNLGCQVLFSGGTGAQGDGGVGHWRRFLEDGNKDGKRIASICHTRPSGYPPLPRNRKHGATSWRCPRSKTAWPP
ncbi:MAG: hypothetical protein ACPF9T_00920, partial [Pseudomonadales bacterium]